MWMFVQALVAILALIAIYYTLERIVERPATHRRFHYIYKQFMRQAYGKGYEEQ